MHYYLAQCWIRPRSGFDLTHKNILLQEFREKLGEAFPGDKRVLKALKTFENKYDGMVLKDFIAESDTVVQNSVKEILPEIRKDYPEAELLTCSKLPDILSYKELCLLIQETQNRR